MSKFEILILLDDETSVAGINDLDRVLCNGAKGAFIFDGDNNSPLLPMTNVSDLFLGKGLNNTGSVVGMLYHPTVTYMRSGETFHMQPVLWHNGDWGYLCDLIDNLSDWCLVNVEDINDSGEIVGELLTPKERKNLYY